MLDAIPDTRLESPDPDTFHARNAAPCGGNWCVVQTFSQVERWANQNLQRAGFTTYLPMAIVRRRDNAIRSLWHRVQVPLFPTYLFLQHDNRDLWRPIRETPGVLAVLRSGDKIHHVRPGVLDAVRAAEAKSAVVGARGQAWAPGAAVALSDGPLAGHPAVVLAVSRETARIAVLLFGELRTITAPVTSLVARE